MKRGRGIPPEVWFSIAVGITLGVGMLVLALLKEPW